MQTNVHFNALPRSIRERFIEVTHDRGAPVPILADRPMTSGMVGVAAVTVAVAGYAIYWLWGRNLGRPYETPWGLPTLAILATILFVAGWTVVTAVLRQIMRKRLPFQPGVYLIGGDLVDARTAKLRIVPLTACEPNIIHHHYNGSYVRTQFKFSPPIGAAFDFSVKPRHAAEAVLDEIQRTVHLLSVVQAIGDREVQAKVDVFHEIRDERGLIVPPGRAPDPVPPLAGDVPRALARPALVALGVAVLALPTWWLRNRAHDDAAFERVRNARDSWQVEAYLRWGELHRDEARGLLVVKKLEEAEDAGTVTALRDFLRNYPDAPEALRDQARAAIHDHFTRALDQFRAIASNDADTVGFVERLIAFEEAHDSPGLRVEFRPPRTEQLAAMDDVLREFSQGKYDFAPLAPHFGDDTAGLREAEIVTSLSQGFARVFSEDVLHLDNGGRVAGDAPAAADRATIDVAYEVRPMQDADGPVIYLLDDPVPYPRLGGIGGPDGAADEDLPTNKRLYMGIEVDFKVTMRVPGHDQPRELTLLVQPPERFSVSTGPGDPSDSSVYAIMTSRAFDELRSKLGSAFFRGGGDVAPDDAGYDDEP